MKQNRQAHHHFALRRTQAPLALRPGTPGLWKTGRQAARWLRCRHSRQQRLWWPRRLPAHWACRTYPAQGEGMAWKMVSRGDRLPRNIPARSGAVQKPR